VLYQLFFPSDFDALVASEQLTSVMQSMRVPFLISGLISYGLTAALFVALLSVLYRQLTGYGQGGQEAGQSA